MADGQGDLIPAQAVRPARLVRSMRIGFCVFWLILFLGVTGMLAVGGQPDPPGLGRVLDGPWRFRPGDDAGWAAPGIDDSSWDRITLVSRPDSRDGDVGIPGYFDGWRAHGHAGLSGYGWYRRQVRVPQRADLVLVGPPVVDDGYELFWNGRRLGGVGKLSAPPSVNATRPMLVSLPPTADNQIGLLAIRAFMQPGDRDAQSGGLRTAPVLASSSEGRMLYRAQWRRTIAGYIVDAVEPLAMVILAGMAVFAAPMLARPSFARWIALGLACSAFLRLGNAITAWTDLLSQPTLSLLRGVILAPLAKLGWTMAWNRWVNGPDRALVSFAAVAAWAILTIGALVDSRLLDGAGRAIDALCLAVIVIRIARHGERRLLALGTMLLTAVGLFAADLSTLGVPGIWFPFNIGVSRSQYAYALALPLLALVLFTTRKSAHQPSSC